MSKPKVEVVQGAAGARFAVRVGPEHGELGAQCGAASHAVEALFLILKGTVSPAEGYAALRIALHTFEDQRPADTVEGDRIFELWKQLTEPVMPEVDKAMGRDRGMPS